MIIVPGYETLSLKKYYTYQRKVDFLKVSNLKASLFLGWMISYVWQHCLNQKSFLKRLAFTILDGAYLVMIIQ